jgi:hypothetical protein
MHIASVATAFPAQRYPQAVTKALKERMQDKLGHVMFRLDMLGTIVGSHPSLCFEGRHFTCIKPVKGIQLKLKKTVAEGNLF